jgi:hypothetical protein
MHNAGERLQLIALSVDPKKEGLARHAQRSIALRAARVANPQVRSSQVSIKGSLSLPRPIKSSQVS